MPRDIVTTLHRGNKPMRSRHYARIDTAIPRATQLALLEGEPGDVVTIHHAVTGLEIGSMKITLKKGQVTLKTQYAWSEK